MTALRETAERLAECDELRAEAEEIAAWARDTYATPTMAAFVRRLEAALRSQRIAGMREAAELTRTAAALLEAQGCAARSALLVVATEYEAANRIEARAKELEK